jgi:hypothetical protein
VTPQEQRTISVKRSSPFVHYTLIEHWFEGVRLRKALVNVQTNKEDITYGKH